MNRRAVVVVLAIAAGIGCATSPAPRYYTIDMQPSHKARAACNIDIGRLRPTEALARNDMLIKKSATEIEYYAADRWASNLGELIREKLETEFGRNPEAEKTVLVSGDILAFEQVDEATGASARIKLDLEFRTEGAARDDGPVLRKIYELTAPAKDQTPGAVAEALSRGLEQLAAAIIEDVNTL